MAIMVSRTVVNELIAAGWREDVDFVVVPDTYGPNNTSDIVHAPRMLAMDEVLARHAASHGGWTFTCDDCYRLAGLVHGAKVAPL